MKTLVIGATAHADEGFLKSRDERKRVEMRLPISKPITDSNACDFEVFRVRATNSISPPSSRT